MRNNQMIQRITDVSGEVIGSQTEKQNQQTIMKIVKYRKNICMEKEKKTHHVMMVSFTNLKRWRALNTQQRVYPSWYLREDSICLVIETGRWSWSARQVEVSTMNISVPVFSHTSLPQHHSIPLSVLLSHPWHSSESRIRCIYTLNQDPSEPWSSLQAVNTSQAELPPAHRVFCSLSSSVC